MTLITPSDRFAIFCAWGMAGSAISRALDRAGYNQHLKPSRAELDLLDPLAVQQLFAELKPTVVVLAAAKIPLLEGWECTVALFLDQLGFDLVRL